MKKINLILIVLSVLLTLSCSSKSTQNKTTVNPEGENSLQGYAVKMGETVLKKYPNIWLIDKYEKPHWSYTHGLVAYAMLQLEEHTGNEEYFKYAKTYADELIDEQGTIKTYKKSDYNIDKINSGKILFTFFEKTGDQRYKTAMNMLRQQLKEHPRTAIGGFWHKKRYPHQMWLDGVYMAGPFYARYAKDFDEPESFDEITAWYINVEKLTRDPETGLLYHGWDESNEQAWANEETGCSPNFWGRGMGWYAMALVDLLDYLPEDHPDYAKIVAIVDRLAKAIVNFQDENTGAWYQVVNQGDREGNYLEGSASAMFSYFLLKAINKSYIDKGLYEKAAKKAFEGLVMYLTKTEADGTLVISPVCAVAGLGGDPYRDGSYEYYINEAKRDNDAKAVGPFILAAIQYEKLMH
ncbi:MAG: glycoside hydrolase family 88 protein [Bacteroidales bacterium]|nr:glycoside hydrolase family 88 protein [Bacteroidales bacterium]